MTPEDIDILRRLVQARSGVVIDRTKPYVLESALGPVARREDFASVDELVAMIRESRDERLMWAVTEALTPTDTMFFRDPAVFGAFREAMLPKLAAQRGGEPIKIWSGACSTGQEIYSLAMLADEDAPKLGSARIELFGSDLSEAALAKAQAGLYTQFEVQRGLPVKMLLRYFERQGEMWRAAPVLRQAIRWRRINLLADLSPIGQFDVVMAPNVTGAFEETTRRRVQSSLAARVREGGYLVLGADEAGAVEGLTPTECPGVFGRGTSAASYIAA